MKLVCQRTRRHFDLRSHAAARDFRVAKSDRPSTMSQKPDEKEKRARHKPAVIAQG